MMDADTLFRRALALAARAHRGQRDKGGHPYIGHPLRVAARCHSPEARVAALLHDTLEDTPLTAATLAEEGIPPGIVDTVCTLTRKPGEDYGDYIHRIAANPLAVEVKIADLEDNMDIRRLAAVGPADAERLNRYLQAWHTLGGTMQDSPIQK